MDFKELKIRNLGIDQKKFGIIFSVVDFGNVNYWFEKDEYGRDGEKLQVNQKLIIDLEKLANFTDLFSDKKNFYYGWNPRKKKSWHIVVKAESHGFNKVTKPMQFIKHYIGDNIMSRDGRKTKRDSRGTYVEIPKSNFDVEICVDAIRLIESYDTFCLFSGDSDFTCLVRFLKKNKKKVIVVASGQVYHTLKDEADLYIKAQDIKMEICSIKETAPLAERGLDIGSVSDGQGS